jgi:hypothetical protein
MIKIKDEDGIIIELNEPAAEMMKDMAGLMAIFAGVLLENNWMSDKTKMLVDAVKLGVHWEAEIKNALGEGEIVDTSWYLDESPEIGGN